MIHHFLKYLLTVVFIIPGVVLFAQQDSLSSTEDSSKVELIFSRKVQGKESSEGRYIYLQGDVHFQQKQMHLWCDTAHRYPSNEVLAYGDVQMLQNDSIRIFSDSLFYNGNTRDARLTGDVVLQDSSMTMFTHQLFYNLNTKIAKYPYGALIVSDSTQLVSKSGYYDANTNEAYFIDSVRLTDPKYKLTADSLVFNTQDEIASFLGPTFIYDDENMLYCEDGYFDNKRNYALLTKNPYYLKRKDGEKTQKAYGDTIIYDGRLNQYMVIGNAVYSDGDKEVKADTILRDEDSDQFDFKGNPRFRSLDTTQTQTIDAVYSYYDSKTETVVFRENVRVEDNGQILESDSLDYSNNTHVGIARGHVVWQDTSSDMRIMCGEAVYNDSTKAFLAKDHPILMTIMDNDSLWLTADTLRAIPDERNEKKRTFYAYYHVKLYKSDIQGLCDSLVYSEPDSMFQFLTQPVLWVDSVQFTATTIRASMSNKKIDKVFLKEQSFIVSTEEERYFNQIKGKNMLAHFSNNKLNVLDVTANGEAVYYLLDEQKRYAGVNDVDCSDMNMYFKNNNVDQIKFTGKPQAIMYPMGQAPHRELQLKGFSWKEAARPKTKFEITQGKDWPPRSLLDPIVNMDTDTLSALSADSLPPRSEPSDSLKNSMISDTMTIETPDLNRQKSRTNSKEPSKEQPQRKEQLSPKNQKRRGNSSKTSSDKQ